MSSINEFLSKTIKKSDVKNDIPFKITFRQESPEQEKEGKWTVQIYSIYSPNKNEVKECSNTDEIVELITKFFNE